MKDRIKSPGQLNSLIKVTKLRTWIMLALLTAAVTAMVIGISTMKIENSIAKTGVVFDNTRDSLLWTGVPDELLGASLRVESYIDSRLLNPAADTFKTVIFYISETEFESGRIAPGMDITVNGQYNGRILFCSTYSFIEYNDIKDVYELTDQEMHQAGYYENHSYISTVAVMDSLPVNEGETVTVKVVTESVSASVFG